MPFPLLAILIIYDSVNNFSVMSGSFLGVSWFEPFTKQRVICLSQGPHR